MDGVLANFELGFLNKWKEKYPNEFYMPLEKRIKFHVKKDYPKELHNKVIEIYSTPNFFSELPQIKGGLEALSEMEKNGHEVYICTSPISNYQYCVPEKYLWVDKNLGSDWVKKIILTRDKTMVKGDFLIDDRPEFSNIGEASWEHILYAQPYNKHIKDKKRITWQNWKSILKI